MNDTQQFAPPAGDPPPGPGDEFDPSRLRTIADMRRSRDDRVVAGVCAGAARYLGIDPIVVRVVIAVLTIAGFAGAIVYVAAWVLVPSDDADKSLAAEWFKLDRNEEQVRVGGLVAAAILAALSIVGDSSWAWWGGAPWWLLPTALVLYVFWVRPRRRREQRERREQVLHDPTADRTPTIPVTRTAAEPREGRSNTLLLLTASLAAIALAVTLIYDEVQEDLPWTTYVAVALAAVGVGLLIGTFFGTSGGLVLIGAVLAVALTVGSALPGGRLGTQRTSPTLAAAVDDHYRHGIGLLELDLTDVSDPDALLGRTVVLDAGIGLTRVVVPDGLPVRIDTDLKAGQISLFGREDDGTDLELSTGDTPPAAAVTIDVDQKVGRIEVIKQ
ncbi:PspC domain-containing protein [Aeromicrobium wangtongii]|uniref:PspC domain-containing protein n=1 Tax=Aeromicrobium wangtongii TaxID=2969247 RepID=UPI002017C15E|nr:PspC domain-containing protein [Aeromicrobium wangtongii]MCL3819780.1 PspC domain-containing protein [Aeromicrobium wangtongii]